MWLVSAVCMHGIQARYRLILSIYTIEVTSFNHSTQQDKCSAIAVNQNENRKEKGHVLPKSFGKSASPPLTAENTLACFVCY